MMKTKKNNSVKTVLTISIGFGIIYFLSDIKWALNTSLIIGVLGLISNKFSDFIDFLWMKLTRILSFIVPNVLLSLIFYLFLFPIAICYKIFGGKDPLQLKNNNETMWVNKDDKLDKSSFEKMW
jgi:hypothetical protein